jgi:hypothetical protein
MLEKNGTTEILKDTWINKAADRKEDASSLPTFHSFNFHFDTPRL